MFAFLLGILLSNLSLLSRRKSGGLFRRMTLQIEHNIQLVQKMSEKRAATVLSYCQSTPLLFDDGHLLIHIASGRWIYSDIDLLLEVSSSFN
jgi:hypothetical protein